jgi:organic radical activating enzyme
LNNQSMKEHLIFFLKSLARKLPLLKPFLEERALHEEINQLKLENESIVSQLKLENESIVSQLKLENESIVSQLKLENESIVSQLKLENESIVSQLHQITASLLKNSSVFDEDVYRSRNAMFSAGYTARNARSEQYRTDGESEYYCCEYLQSLLNIDLDGLALCCHPHSGNRGIVRIGKFHGNTLPIDLLLSARLKLTQDINSGIDTPCTGCDLLEKRRWKKAYPIKYLVINDWTECNLRCKYCYTLNPNSPRFSGEKRTHHLPLLIEDMFANKYIDPEGIVDWGGGEVTLYKDFEPVAAMFAERRIRQNVNTNAVRFSSTIERGLREKTMSVQVSVDAGTRETYQQVKGRDAFEPVWENIGKYAQAGDLTVKYIIYNLNSQIENVHNFIRLCQQHQVISVVLTPEVRQDTQGTFTDDTLRNVAIFAHEAKQAQLNLKLVPFLPKAQAKINEYSILLC